MNNLKKFNEDIENTGIGGIRGFKGDPVDFIADFLLTQASEWILKFYPELGGDELETELDNSGIIDDDEIYEWSKDFLDLLLKRAKNYLDNK